MSCRPEQGNKTEHIRKPDWLKIKLNTNDNYTGLKKLMRENNLNTVCEEARCPNIHECWGERWTATFMILGAVCTRACRFCAVKTGLPTELDLAEPERVADSVAIMNLKHAVVTAVARDDQKDGDQQFLLKQSVQFAGKIHSQLSKFFHPIWVGFMKILNA